MIRTDRAVEVLHNAGTDKDPDWSVGSGYLIGGRLVLTAAHNVGAGECLVRMVDSTEHPAAVLRRGEEIRLDLAVLELTGKDAPDLGEGVRYAIVSQEQAEVIKWCTGLGFPRFKEDKTRPRPGSGKALRNIEQLDGEIPTAAGALANLLTFRVAARPREHQLPTGAEEFADSPWQGVSGTVVFARGDPVGDRAVGVVTEHHLAEGGSALTVVPIGAISAPGVLPAEERQAWWDLLGVPDPAALPLLPRRSSRRRPRPPVPPRGAVARAELAAATLAALRDGPAPLVGLVGGPGFGKSVLARLVAAAVDARADSFAGDGGDGWCPGGVVWLDVGQDPDLARLLAQGLTDLTGQPAEGRSVEQLASYLGEELAARRCLLVLDDVWPSRTSQADVIGLVLSRIENVPCLVTTRSAALVDAARGARRIDVEEMGPGETDALLATALPEQATENELAQLGEFARRLGRWPLLLGLAAAHLRRQVSGGVPVDEAVRELSGRYASKGVTAFDARSADQLDASDPAQRQRAVAAAVEASLGLLPRDDQVRYRELAVFPAGQPVPVEVIAGLWAPTVDRYDTDDLLGMLADLSLLSLDMRTRHVRVHDLLRDYVLPADPQRREALHRRLFESWGDPRGLRDSYRIRWYAYHLDTAGDSDRLYALITPAWRDRILAVTGALSDIAADALRAAEHAARQHNLPEELRCRIIITSLAERAQALPRPLLAALAQLGRLDRALGSVTLLPPSERGAALRDIATALAGTDLSQVLAAADRITDLSQVLAAADRITDPGYKAHALAGVAVALGRTDPDRALAIADRIDDPRAKAWVLTGIAAAIAGADPDRASRLIDQALAIADPIDDAWAKALALADIAPALARTDPDRARRLTDQALAIADRIDHPWEKAQTLAEIAPALAHIDPDRALAIADRIGDRWYETPALAHIAVALARTDPDRALAAADRIEESEDYARVLADIAAALAGTDPDRALAIADRIDVPWAKARALASIAAALAGADPGRASQLTDRALAAADRIDGPRDKGWALAGIAIALGRTDPDRALAAADRIDSPEDKARVLASIAAALAGTDPGRASRLADQALAAADRIGGPRDKPQALAGIAAALGRTDPDQALAIADRIDVPCDLAITDRIDDSAYKAEKFSEIAVALAGIAAALAGADPGRASQLADRALAAAGRIDSLWDKVGALIGIAAALAGTDPDRALAAADRLDSPRHKAQALTGIAAALAGTDPGRASQLADRALAAAGRIDDPWGKAEALAGIAAALVGTDPDRALAITDRIDDSAYKAGKFSQIAVALAGTDPDRALAITDRIDDPRAKAQALTGIAAALAGTNPGRASQLADRALAAAGRIDSPWDKARALADIAAALAGTDPGRASQLADRALAAAGRIDDPWFKDRALTDIADALAGTDPDRALAAADHIDDLLVKAQALAALARTDPDRALAAADRINDPWFKAEALAYIAPALAGTDPDRALAVAADINDSWFKQTALGGIARALAGTDPDRALAAADRIDSPRDKAQALANLADVRAGLASNLDAVGQRRTSSGFTNDLTTRLRSLDPATGNDAWWKFAQLLVTLATRGPERNELVHAVLAADEW